MPSAWPRWAERVSDHLPPLPPPPPPPATWGAPSDLPWPAPPPPPSGRHVPARLRALGAVIALVLVVGAGVIVTRSVDNGPGHPDAWDPRVAALATYVERTRGLEFDHPVYVDFLSPADYTAATTSEEDALDDAGRAELDRYAGQLRALGVAEGEVDLFRAYNKVSDDGTLAFYDPALRRVKVRGTALTVGLRVTLVHELTHALQDQHFDLERLYSSDLDDSAAVALRALIEGDAMRIEQQYTGDELTDDEQQAYDDEYNGQIEDSAAALSDVPAFLNATFGVPYAFGQPLVLMIANDGGNRAVDEAFRKPPTTEEHLFDPASFLAGEGAADVDLELGDDVEVLDEGQLGSPAWYLVLAERIDPKVAFEATLGWGGDAFATFQRGKRSCLRAAFRGDTERDEREMAAALATWADAMPGGRVTITDTGGHPTVEACDPGPDVDMELTNRSEDALYLPTLWGFLVADAATAVDADGARCYAGHVIAGLTWEQIADPDGAVFDTDAFQELANRAFETCT